MFPRPLSKMSRLGVWICATVCGAQSNAQSLFTDQVVSGLSTPAFAAAPPDDTDRLFITEQNAVRVRIFDPATNMLLPTPFLDLPDVAGQQSGLQTIAFHPDYATNGRCYINLFDGANVRIVEYTVSSSDRNVADPASERQILSIPNPTGSHNGGWLGFSPIDGNLYIATGDGGTFPGPDQGLPAQDLSSLYGKVLRVDVDGDDFPENPTRNYAIPPHNPLVGAAGEDEIFASGLRHPFRAGFDRATGDLYIGDVGSQFWEEINLLSGTSAGGENFGWRPKEGFVDNPTFADPLPPDAVDPIHVYAHGSGAAVIGGYNYRGAAIPSLHDTYFFLDFVKKQISSFQFDGANVTNLTDRTAELFVDGSASFGLLSSFAEDKNGEILLIDRNQGKIYRVVARSGASLTAASDIWISNGSGLWSDDTRWQDGTAPVAGGGTSTVVEFNHTGSGPAPFFTNDLGAPFTLNGLILSNPGKTEFTLDGAPVLLADDNLAPSFIEVLGTNRIDIGLQLELQSTTIVQGGANEIRFLNDITGSGGLVIDREALALTSIDTDTSYTGATELRQGRLLLRGTGGITGSSSLTAGSQTRVELEYSAPDDKIGDGSPVTLGGEVVVRNNSGGPLVETVGNLELVSHTAGGVTVAGNGAETVWSADSLITQAGAVALFRGQDLGQSGSASRITFATAPALIGGGGPALSTTRSILPHIVGDSSEVGMGRSFVTYDEVHGIVPLDPVSEYAADITSGSTTSENVRATTATTNVDAPTSINSLLLAGGGSVSGSGDLTITSGLVLTEGGPNGGIHTGSLVFGTGGSLIWTNSELTISSEINSAAGLNKAGPAALTLSGNADISGTTAVVDGDLRMAGGTLTTDLLILNGSDTILDLVGGTVSATNIQVTNGGSTELPPGQSLTVPETISLENGGSILLSGGSLTTGTLASQRGRFTFVSGILDITGSDLLVDDLGALGAFVTLDPNKTLRVAESLVVGSTGMFIIDGGSLTTNALVLDGPGSRLNVLGGTTDITNLVLQNGSNLELTPDHNLTIVNTSMLQGGSSITFSGGTLETGSLVNSGGTYALDQGLLRLTNSGLAVDDTGPLGPDVTLGDGMTLDVSGTTTVGATGSLTLTGGTLQTAAIQVEGGDFNFLSGSVYVTASAFSIGENGPLGPSLAIRSGMLLSVTDTTTITSSGSLSLLGGTFETNQLILDGQGSGFQPISGTSAVQAFSLFNGASTSIGAGQDFSVMGTTTVGIGSVLRLDGGSFTTGLLTIDGAFQFNGGTLRITGQNMTVGSGGLFGATVALGSGKTLVVDNAITVDIGGLLYVDGQSSVSADSLTNNGEIRLGDALSVVAAASLVNNGLVHGNGTVNAALTNSGSGEVRIADGQRLLFSAQAASTNSGLMDVIGGEIEFQSHLSNGPSTGLITGRDATMRFGGGLTNAGSIGLSFGANDIFGPITNDGSMVLSGESFTTFFDDVVNNGTIQVSSGSRAVFFGSYNGSGTSGTGAVFIEGDLRPGQSPAAVHFGGNVSFGATATLEIEIGGIAPGSRYDQVHAAGGLSVDGKLALSIIDGFAPRFGDTFTVLTAAAITGRFSQIDSDLAPLGLSSKAHLMAWLVDSDQVGRIDLVVGVRADMDYDEDADFDDIAPFVLGLNNPQEYAALYGHGASAAGDMDLDEDLDFDDIPGFVDRLLQTLVVSHGRLGIGSEPVVQELQPVPEPTTAALLMGLGVIGAAIVMGNRVGTRFQNRRDGH